MGASEDENKIWKSSAGKMKFGDGDRVYSFRTNFFFFNYISRAFILLGKNIFTGFV
jgi:hypothetical protein